jgi:hypothetical protein
MGCYGKKMLRIFYLNINSQRTPDLSRNFYGVDHTLWITLVTTPQISKAMSGLISMGAYLSFSGSSDGRLDPVELKAN